jgi:hypothetical protein
VITYHIGSNMVVMLVFIVAMLKPHRGKMLMMFTIIFFQALSSRCAIHLLSFFHLLTFENHY